jgi:hypothetical protein
VLIYRDDDRSSHVVVISARDQDCFDARLLAQCLMGNHFLLVVPTRRANLWRLMRRIKAVYAQTFNHRCIEGNPVAAGLLTKLADSPYSSHRAHVGLEPTPPAVGWRWRARLLAGPSVNTAGKARPQHRKTTMVTATWHRSPPTKVG